MRLLNTWLFVEPIDENEYYTGNLILPKRENTKFQRATVKEAGPKCRLKPGMEVDYRPIDLTIVQEVDSPKLYMIKEIDIVGIHE